MNVAVSDPTTPHGIRLTVKDFLLLHDSGAFDAYSKSELIDGEIVCVNSQFRRHAMAKSELFYELRGAAKRTDDTLIAIVEVAVELDGSNLLEPDIILTRYSGTQRTVPGDSVVLAVEVSDTTLQYDLKRKAVRYAAAGIPEYWVVDVAGRAVHQLWSPEPDGYAERRRIALGTPLDSATIAGLRVATASL